MRRFSINQVKEVSEVRAAVPTRIPQQSSSNKARERVRSVTRRVQQSASLGGYWLFSGGRPVFIRTVGKKVRSGKQKQAKNLDKLPTAPKANRTVNTSKQKRKDKIDKKASKTPTKVANINRVKPKTK